jgi:hypothetical protein
LKQLFDERLSLEIARQLREHGHDVVAVGDCADLRGRPDRVHFASLPDEQRAIVTRDLGNFRPLLAEALRRGSGTHGSVWVPARFPLNRDGIERLVAVLDALPQAHPEVDAAVSLGGEIWLQDPARS